MAAVLAGIFRASAAAVPVIDAASLQPDAQTDPPALRLVVLTTTWAKEEPIHTHNVRTLTRLHDDERVPRGRRGRCVLYAINAIDNDVAAWQRQWVHTATEAGIRPLVHSAERDLRRGGSA